MDWIKIGIFAPPYLCLFAGIGYSLLGVFGLLAFPLIPAAGVLYVQMKIKDAERRRPQVVYHVDWSGHV